LLPAHYLCVAYAIVPNVGNKSFVFVHVEAKYKFKKYVYVRGKSL